MGLLHERKGWIMLAFKAWQLQEEGQLHTKARFLYTSFSPSKS
jgi:hypothetical protein